MDGSLCNGGAILLCDEYELTNNELSNMSRGQPTSESSPIQKGLRRGSGSKHGGSGFKCRDSPQEMGGSQTPAQRGGCMLAAGAMGGSPRASGDTTTGSTGGSFCPPGQIDVFGTLTICQMHLQMRGAVSKHTQCMRMRYRSPREDLERVELLRHHLYAHEMKQGPASEYRHLLH